MQTSYEAVIIGSRFGSFFFLHEFLKRRGAGRILLVEWGAYKTHDWQLKNKTNSVYDSGKLYTHGRGEKRWTHRIGFGGDTLSVGWAIVHATIPMIFA